MVEINRIEIDGHILTSYQIRLNREEGLKILNELRRDLPAMHNLKNIEVRIRKNKYEVEYDIEPPKFERIRRITGYLVGTLDRWNDSKKAEESERVKHEP